MAVRKSWNVIYCVRARSGQMLGQENFRWPTGPRPALTPPAVFGIPSIRTMRDNGGTVPRRTSRGKSLNGRVTCTK